MFTYCTQWSLLVKYSISQKRIAALSIHNWHLKFKRCNKNLLSFDLVWFYWDVIRKSLKKGSDTVYVLLHLCFLKDACWGLLTRLSPTLYEVLNLNSRSFDSHQILPSLDACNLDWKLDSDPSTHHTQVLTLRILVHFQVDRQVDTSKDRHAPLKVEFNFTHILCFPNSPLSVPKRKTAIQNYFWRGISANQILM